MENKKRNTIIIVIIVVVVLLLLIWFLTSGSGDGGSATGTVGMNEVLKTKEGTEIKVTGVEEYVRDEFPSQGNYVKVSLTITNTSSETVNVNVYELNLENGNGDSASAFSAFSVDNKIELGDMAPNETLTGDLYFRVDYTDSGMKLEYLPVLSNGDVGNYIIELN